MTTCVQLSDRLDYLAVGPLLSELKGVTDDDLILDASAVRHLGALPLQILLSTIKTRAAAAKRTTLSEPSDSCVDALGLFGFSPQTLTQPEAWT
ncbi:hypothetical protein [Celeribacter litoreus]|uniref:hypothetical protein n=1 Tax=Celeribacter litoreus TaxID=2876714 RepID=UPI001CCB9CB4|nr:hypothetical protein [Celeribacter litoreus]MCA0044973.1 hypothetical protein [Celeribacter litoreus]